MNREDEKRKKLDNKGVYIVHFKILILRREGFIYYDITKAHTGKNITQALENATTQD